MTGRPTRRLLALTAASLAAFAVVATALSQTASGFDLSWRGAFGGGSSSGGSYVTQGVIGQPFAASSSAASYQVGSGFLGGGAVKFKRFLPALSNDGTP
jgi:hypothetical protein